MTTTTRVVTATSQSSLIFLVSLFLLFISFTLSRQSVTLKTVRVVARPICTAPALLTPSCPRNSKSHQEPLIHRLGNLPMANYCVTLCKVQSLEPQYSFLLSIDPLSFIAWVPTYSCLPSNIQSINLQSVSSHHGRPLNTTPTPPLRLYTPSAEHEHRTSSVFV
ncbi:hypothetical protein GQ44DRAFT_67702 [Phaeosphaeriaceae sp. PMI808]|nr:hypothetical protein GQ44DRAFT_67702 [Phaeosphaeriaceae sp. PMI808]